MTRLKKTALGTVVILVLGVSIGFAVAKPGTLSLNSSVSFPVDI